MLQVHQETCHWLNKNVKCSKFEFQTLLIAISLKHVWDLLYAISTATVGGHYTINVIVRNLFVKTNISFSLVVKFLQNLVDDKTYVVETCIGYGFVEPYPIRFRFWNTKIWTETDNILTGTRPNRFYAHRMRTVSEIVVQLFLFNVYCFEVKKQLKWKSEKLENLSFFISWYVTNKISKFQLI